MKNLINNFLSTILLLSIFSTFSLAQNAALSVDALVEEAMTKFNVAGLAVGIVKDGKVIHAKGYGVKSSVTKVPVNKDTNFAIASNTKAFTCAALAMLVEDGKLNWTDKVKDHIPEFKMYNAYVTDNFNIQDLLTHRSGLGLGIGDLMIFPDGGDFTIDDLLASFQHFEPVSALRTKFDYDNLLYMVAGELVHRVSGMPWDAFVTKRIFEPLQMDQTYAAIELIKDRTNIAIPHASEKGKLRPIDNFNLIINGAAGSIYSNVDDLTNWMLVQLNQGKYGAELDQNLFSTASQREMWKIHTVLNANPDPRYNSHFAGYGLGWFLTDVKGNMLASHTGGLPGMLSKTILIPDLNLGVVVLTNTSDDGAGVFSSVSQTIVDNYLGLEDFGWVDKYAARFAERAKEGDAVTEEAWKVVAAADASCVNESDYIGIYEDKWFGKIEIYSAGDQLQIKCHRSPKLQGSMHFYKANTFAVKWDYQDMNCDVFASFHLDENGQAQAIRMKGISPNIDFSFDFQDLRLERVE